MTLADLLVCPHCGASLLERGVDLSLRYGWQPPIPPGAGIAPPPVRDPDGDWAIFACQGCGRVLPSFDALIIGGLQKQFGIDGRSFQRALMRGRRRRCETT